MIKIYNFLGLILCKVGWHNFVFSVQDCIDEFGFVPNDKRIPKKAKCKRCGEAFCQTCS